MQRYEYYTKFKEYKTMIKKFSFSYPCKLNFFTPDFDTRKIKINHLTMNE